MRGGRAQVEDSLDPRRRSCWLGSGVVLEAAADDIRRLHQGWTVGITFYSIYGVYCTSVGLDRDDEAGGIQCVKCVFRVSSRSQRRMKLYMRHATYWTVRPVKTYQAAFSHYLFMSGREGMVLRILDTSPVQRIYDAPKES